MHLYRVSLLQEQQMSFEHRVRERQVQILEAIVTTLTRLCEIESQH